MFFIVESPSYPPKKKHFFFWAVQLEWRYRICPKKMNMNKYTQDQLALPVFPLGPVFCFSCPNRCLPCYMWAASWSPLYNISLPRSERHLCNATATAGIRHMPFVVYTLRHLLCNLSSKQPSISLLLPKYFGWPLVPFFISFQL